MSTVVVITSLNEIDGVKKLLPTIKKEWAEEWLVVDGNSTDGTIDEVKRLGFDIPYYRFPKFKEVENNDVVIFEFPRDPFQKYVKDQYHSLEYAGHI